MSLYLTLSSNTRLLQILTKQQRNKKWSVKTVNNFDHASSLMFWPRTIAKSAFLINCTSNLLLITYYLPMNPICQMVGYKQLCCFLTHLVSFNVNQNLLARALRNLFFSIDTFLSTSSSQGVFSFYKINCRYLCHFYHICVIQHWLMA